jgi:hypothetical protein
MKIPPKCIYFFQFKFILFLLFKKILIIFDRVRYLLSDGTIGIESSTPEREKTVQIVPNEWAVVVITVDCAAGTSERKRGRRGKRRGK